MIIDDVKSLVEDQDLVAKRRSQLIHAAIALFSKVGFHQTTVKQIAGQAGVSAGLVYQYVPEKQDLLFIALKYIVQRNFEEIPAALAKVKEPLARLHASMDAYTRVIDANREAVVLTYRETKSLKPEYIEIMKKLELDTNALIAECVDECAKEGLLTPVNTELLVYQMIMNAHAWALKHWRLAKIVTLDEYLEQSIHSSWMKLLTPKGGRHLSKLNGA